MNRTFKLKSTQEKLRVVASATLWVVKVSALVCFIILTWILGVRVIKQTDILLLPYADLASILFGASSLALFVFSSFIALLAIVGWKALNDTIREQVQISTNAKAQALENESKGRTFSAIGYILAESALRQAEGVIEIIDKQKLSEAILFLQRGYNLLRLIGGAAEYMALNNLVFYSLIDDDKPRAGYLIEKAHDLMRAGQEHNNADLMLTACGVVLRYGTDGGKREEALMILKVIQENPRQPLKRRNEAKYYLSLAPPS